MQGTQGTGGGLGGFRLGGQGGLQLGGGQGTGGLQLGGGQSTGGLQLGGGGLQLGGGQGTGGLQLGGGGLQLGGGQGTGGLQLGGGLQVGGQPNTMAGAPQGNTTGGLSLGGLNTGGGLKLGGGQGAGGGGGLRLGQTTGLQLGQQQTSGGLQLGQQQASGGLQLGQQQASGGLQLGQQQTSSGLQLGQLSSAGGLKLGQQSLGQNASTGGLQLGQARGLPPPSYTTATAPTPGLQLTNQTISSSGLQLGGLSTQTPKTGGPQPGLQLGGQRTGGGLQLGGVGVAKPAPTLGGVPTSLSKPVSLGTPSTLGGLKVGPSFKTTAAGAVSTATTGAPPSYAATKKYTYKELETLINKWTLELQGQEELFLKQATQVNKWDRTLSENGDKIVELHGEVDRVKTEQERVNNELEMIEGQQSELNDLLASLESRIDHAPTHTGHHADMQRNRTFTMAETVDSQLKQMSTDLKMIIEQMNKSNTSADDENPFTQIVRILNAHTDSLGWIDHEAALLRKKVDDVAKVTDYHRREQEHSFRKLAFSHQ
ncbi:nuclear pore glycoprotein p62-like isoform X2 [Halichondria panicea]|uniref:nuclear pore glycoprotein p62-like isoform X2 n=1 Tax=Halichondria panicea TaxID=6063 RepID=UPI00312BAF14